MQALNKEKMLLDDLMDRFSVVRILTLYHLRRRGHRLTGGDLAVSRSELADTLGLERPQDEPGLEDSLGLPSYDVLAEALATCLLRLDLRRRQCVQAGFELPFQTLQRAFNLHESEMRLLATQLAIQSDMALFRALRVAWGDFTERRGTVGFFCEFVTPQLEHQRALNKGLSPDSPLIRYRLLTLESSKEWGDDEHTPRFHRTLCMPQRVEHFLLYGDMPSDKRSQRMWHAETSEVETESLILPDGFAQALKATLNKSRSRAAEGTPLRMSLVAPPGTGRRQILRALLPDQGCLTIHLDALVREAGGHPETLRIYVAEALRDALIAGVCPLVRNAEHLQEDEHLELFTLFEAHPQPLFFSASQSESALERCVPGLVELRATGLTQAQQGAVWRHQLEPDFEGEARTHLASTLSRQFLMTPGAIHRAMARARSQRRGRRTRAADVQRAVQRSFEHELSTLAETMTTRLTWDDLVVPEALREKIHEIKMALRHSDHVLNHWGFGHKFDRGRGLACLFSGEPGTGKTMTALLIAREFGRQTFRVDLSRVVDKYIGETEKNLGRIFDEAERAQAVLLFDEADSLFGKRTDVSNANDRYANLEVNYLLQRIEAFDGICVLTTNRDKGIDEAFKRRIRFHLAFPFPDEEIRAKLWRSMFPPQAQHDPNIPWDELAEHKLAGGAIKNVVLQAAFYAAEDASIITAEHLFRAAERELAKMGQLVRRRV